MEQIIKNTNALHFAKMDFYSALANSEASEAASADQQKVQELCLAQAGSKQGAFGSQPWADQGMQEAQGAPTAGQPVCWQGPVAQASFKPALLRGQQWQGVPEAQEARAAGLVTQAGSKLDPLGGQPWQSVQKAQETLAAGQPVCWQGPVAQAGSKQGPLGGQPWVDQGRQEAQGALAVWQPAAACGQGLVAQAGSGSKQGALGGLPWQQGAASPAGLQVDLTNSIFAGLERAALRQAQEAGARGPWESATATTAAAWTPMERSFGGAAAAGAYPPVLATRGEAPATAALGVPFLPVPPRRATLPPGPSAQGPAGTARAAAPRAAAPSTGRGGKKRQRLLAPGVTTLTVRNVPARYSQDRLIKEWGPDCSYDFLYLPYNAIDKKTSGYAFVNFTSHGAALAFQQRWHGQFLTPQSCTRALDIVAAPVQGYEDNLQFVAKSLSKSFPDGLLPATFRGGRRLDTRAELQNLPPPYVRRGNQDLEVWTRVD